MFFKLAGTTFASYIGMALIRQLVLFLLVRTQRAVGIRRAVRNSASYFGVIWFVSFVLAWRIFLSTVRSKLPLSLN
jgi:hypothetical protein